MLCARRSAKAWVVRAGRDRTQICGLHTLGVFLSKVVEHSAKQEGRREKGERGKGGKWQRGRKIFLVVSAGRLEPHMVRICKEKSTASSARMFSQGRCLPSQGQHGPSASPRSPAPVRPESAAPEDARAPCHLVYIYATWHAIYVAPAAKSYSPSHAPLTLSSLSCPQQPNSSRTANQTSKKFHLAQEKKSFLVRLVLSLPALPGAMPHVPHPQQRPASSRTLPAQGTPSPRI